MIQSGVLQPQQQSSLPPPPPPPPPPLQQQQLAHHTIAAARVLQASEKDWRPRGGEVRGMEHYSWGVPAPRRLPPMAWRVVSFS